MRKSLKNYFLPHKDNNWKPHLLEKGSLCLVIIFSLLVFAGAMSYQRIVSSFDFLSSVYASVLADLANENRTKDSIGKLAVSPVLNEAARLKAEDMAKNGYFSHNSPDGKSPWYWFRQAGYDFEYAGENLAIDFSDSEAVDQAWMNSFSHRENILNKKFTEVGIAVSKGFYQGRETLFVVQLFGTPINVKGPSVPTEKRANVQNDRDKKIVEEARNQVLGAITSRGESNSVERLISSPSRISSYIYIFVMILLLFAIIPLTFLGGLKNRKGDILIGLSVLVVVLALSILASRLNTYGVSIV